MSFTEIKGARTHDSYFKAVHPTGLTIYVYPVSYTHLTLPTNSRV